MEDVGQGEPRPAAEILQCCQSRNLHLESAQLPVRFRHVDVVIENWKVARLKTKEIARPKGHICLDTALLQAGDEGTEQRFWQGLERPVVSSPKVAQEDVHRSTVHNDVAYLQNAENAVGAV